MTTEKPHYGIISSGNTSSISAGAFPLWGMTLIQARSGIVDRWPW
ncbi:MAG TPA: hypothetical protein VG323_15210 [Thermoanaerobaculia bacterium]|nr:hypothetical protein [Thermoanaerobaculia bacterium]